VTADAGAILFSQEAGAQPGLVKRIHFPDELALSGIVAPRGAVEGRR
jgi:hypothetical protein